MCKYENVQMGFKNANKKGRIKITLRQPFSNIISFIPYLPAFLKK